jgi:hypothetical protein
MDKTMRSKSFVSLVTSALLLLLVPVSAMAITDDEYLTRYGTSRRAVKCSAESRIEPKAGRLKASQATKILRCLRESEGQDFDRRMIEFIDILSLEVGPPRKVTEVDSLQSWTINQIDKSRPMYDIKARAVFYNCYPINYDPEIKINQPGKNCQVYGSDTSNSLNSSGICFKDLTKKWLCRLTTSGARISGPPPLS